MDYTVFDMEADALLDDVTTIYCFSWWRSDGTSGTITDISKIPAFIDQQNILVGHNIKRYDNPVIKKLLNYIISKGCIDTLGLSWYLFPEMKKHGLEVWGNILGVAKPVISDWKNLTIAEYVHRCETDVVINKLLFFKQIKKLNAIYAGQDISAIMFYLTYKLDCAAEQEEVKIKIDLEHCKRVLAEINGKLLEKINILSGVMPQVDDVKMVKKPAKIYKINNELSVKGSEWLELLSDKGLPADWLEDVPVLKSSEPGNPQSPQQLKSWLLDLGWKPVNYKYAKSKITGKVSVNPQVSKDGQLCPNIEAMIEQYPYLSELKSLTMLIHRQGVFKGFLQCADANGYMKAEIEGLTNTLRFKHKKPIANLPGVGKPYGKEIRGAIIIPSEDYLFCGSDMSSLEDTTKQHYMYYYDPEYVMQMRVPGFDPHLDIGILSNLLTTEQSDRFKHLDKQHDLSFEEMTEFAGLKKIRGKAKVVNFSGVYGAGPAKIALTTGMTLEEATLLHTIYWQRNKAVKQIARDITIRVFFKDGTNGQYTGRQLLSMSRTDSEAFMQRVLEMWLFNPVSKFWYSLRYPKDIFSTLNQGTGVFCFDTWIKHVRVKGVKIALQYHDEIGFPFLKENLEATKLKLNTAIQETNNLLKLNVPLGISIDVGANYADCH